MQKTRRFLSAVLAAAAVCSAAYAAVAVDDGASSAQSSDTSETSEAPETSNSNSGLTGNYVHLSIPRGEARIDFKVGDQLCAYPNIRGGARCAIPVGCSGTLTIDREGYTIISVKIGNSTAKRDMTKVSDGVYSFTIEEGDTDMYVIFEGEESDNNLNLHMSGGQAAVKYTTEKGQKVEYPNVGGGARFHVPVGCSGTITIDRPGYNIIAVKIGNSTAKRDMTKNSDTEYAFTIQEGDTDMYVIFEGDDAESSAPKPTPTTPARPKPERNEPAETTHESAPEADTNPDTGIALALPAAALSTAAVIVATKKRK